MKELLAAVLSEDENGNFSLAFHLEDLAQQTHRLDKLLSALVQARVAMQPPVDAAPPKAGAQIRPIVNSGWQADPAGNGDLLMSLHHPALGWVSWLFPKSMAQDLALGLNTVVAPAAPPTGQIQ